MSAALRAPELIAAKRDGHELTADQLEWFVTGYLQGLSGAGQDAPVSEGQMGAFLMAGVLSGFTEAEALALTGVLTESGDQLDLSDLRGPTVDKHSTGGVGDGTTLLVAPLLASAGVQLVKLSGRGLGHTGGTLDKLEAIPGFRVALEPHELHAIADDVGCVIAAQTAKLVPADKALYALRDVTATVESMALIASSVMSKKLASGAETIVLDVKAGNGAFMASAEAAAGLADLCVRIGSGAGRRCAALVTAMDHPLGTQIGNALEVAECIRLLQTRPQGRLAEVACELAAVGLAGAHGELNEKAVNSARDELVQRWERGEALDHLTRMIKAQGGDSRVTEDPVAVLPQAPVQLPVAAGAPGYLSGYTAKPVGALAASLGAGRTRAQDPVDPAVGVVLHAEPGSQVTADTVVATIHARTDAEAEDAATTLRDLTGVNDRPPPPAMTVLDRIIG